MDISNFATFLAVGAVSGWIASYLMRGKGFGILGNIITGIFGSIVGGFVFAFIGLTPDSMVGSIITATVGAALLLFIVGYVRSK